MAERFILHGSAASLFTYKVGLMLSLCGERFSFRYVRFAARAHKAPEFLALNRYGQAPVLQHGDRTLCQSAAILEYLSEILGKFGVRDVATRQRIREWLCWDADRLSPGIYRSQGYKRGLFQRHGEAADPALVRHFRDQAEAGLAVLDDNLAGKSFLAGGAPTIADIACYGAVAFAGEGGLDIEQRRHILSWTERLAALPGHHLPYDLLAMEDKEVG
jgi:glutathione S-transferase